MQELILRWSAAGHTWARVVIPIDAKNKVVVRFNEASGKVKIHLSTSERALGEAIAHSWASLQQQLRDAGITLEDLTYDTSSES
jgi:hypothetical protein